MAHIYLALGSNLGDRYGRLIEAFDRLQSFVALDAISSICETEPWGYADQPAFSTRSVGARPISHRKNCWGV